MDLWLKADYPIGPFTTQPIEQAVADVLAKAPWAGWQTGEVAFRYDFIDRPEAGTALLAMLNPVQRPPPPDGLRYLHPESIERRTVTRHTVACPTSVSSPTQNQPIQIELECFTSFQGHLPPTSRSQILPSNSPELRLTRFRKRWRITNGQFPGLWFFWWGRDEHGGAGSGGAPIAPQGWDRSPCRVYPLVKDPNVPTQPMYPFPSPSRMPPQSQQQQPQTTGGSRTAPALPPGTPQTRNIAGSPPQQYASGLQSQQQQPYSTPNPHNPMSRQEQLAALTASHGGLNPSNPTLEARQAQYYAQQQQQFREAQARALAAAGGSAGGGGGGGGLVPGGYALSAVQHQQAQQQLAAQQQQQAAARIALQQQQQQAVSMANNQRSTAIQPQTNQRKPPPPSATTQPSLGQAQPPIGAISPSHLVPPTSLLDSEVPQADILDLLSARQLTMYRLTTSQESIAPLFDPWSIESILRGENRRREIEEAERNGGESGIDMKMGHGGSKGGIAGYGREHTLTILGTTAARVGVNVVLGKDPKKLVYGFEERKDKLNQMLKHHRQEIESMQRKHDEKVKKIKSKPALT